MPIQFQRLPERDHRGAVETCDRPLAARIELPERFDQIANELSAGRVAVPGWKEVDHPAPHTELSVRFNRIAR